MGRNVGGGGGHKKFGRKHGATSSSKLRESQSDEEIYGVATKLLGNNMFNVMCVDKGDRVCHIRGKFSGRSRRQNMVAVGTWVLVGLNDFNIGNRHGKVKEGCDLLEVYTDAEKRQLQATVVEDWVVLASNDPSARHAAATIANDTFDFSNDVEAEECKEFMDQTRAAIAVSLAPKTTEAGAAAAPTHAAPTFIGKAAAVDIDDI